MKTVANRDVIRSLIENCTDGQLELLILELCVYSELAVPLLVRLYQGKIGDGSNEILEVILKRVSKVRHLYHKVEI